MPGAIVQTVYAVDDSGATATTIAVAINGVAAGSALDAFVGFGDGGTETCTVSDGTAYTADAAGKKRDTGNSQSSQNFYRLNAGSGNYTITATLGSAEAFRHIRGIELSSIQTSAAEDKATGQYQAAPGTGANGVSSGATAATANANDFVLGLSQNTQEADPGSGTLTAGTGYTISGSNLILGVESKSVSATGAQTATFTQSVGNSRTTHVIAFKEASAAAAVQGGRLRKPSIHPGAGPNTYGRLMRSRRYNTAGLATITGTLATTNANDTSAAAGSPVVNGSLATTNANDTSTGAGEVFPTPYRRRAQGHPGTGPYNLGRFFKSRRYTTAATVTPTGSLATTNGDDTSAASGTTTIVGTLAKANANDTSAASGTTTVLGTVAKTNADDTSAAAGTTTVLGTLARTNANDASAAAGSPTVNGTLAKTNADDTLAASGAAGAAVGTVAATNANDSVSAEGVVPRSGGIPPRFKPVIWVRLKVDDEEVTVAEEDAPEAAEKLARKAIKRIARTGVAQTPAITVEGPVSREAKREIRAHFRAEFNRDAGVIAAKASLRAQQEREDEETLLWLI